MIPQPYNNQCEKESLVMVVKKMIAYFRELNGPENKSC